MSDATNDPRIFTNELYRIIRLIEDYADFGKRMINTFSSHNGYGLTYWDDDPPTDLTTNAIFDQLDNIYINAANIGNIIQYVAEEDKFTKRE